MKSNIYCNLIDNPNTNTPSAQTGGSGAWRRGQTLAPRPVAESALGH